ncbi:MAG: FHA domain-containing protein [Actinomycetota bacterium]
MGEPARHAVSGSGGTVIAAPGVVALVAAPPDSSEVATWTAVAFDATGATADDVASRARASHESPAVFAVVAAGADGPEVVQHGAVSVDRVTAAGEGDVGLRISLVGHEGADAAEPPHVADGWLAIGVMPAGAVVVGRLGPPRRRGAPSDIHSGSVDPVPTATPDAVDLGNLVAAPVAASTEAAGAPTDALVRIDGADAEPHVADGPVAPEASADAARADATAAFVDVDRLRAGRLVHPDGTDTPLDAPVVAGRRPPTEPIAGVVPHSISVDDRRLSRHHATFRVVDGAVVVVDEGSTNGTFVFLDDDGRPVALDPDDANRREVARRRCPAEQPVELPDGAAIDLGGVLTLVHEAAPC